MSGVAYLSPAKKPTPNATINKTDKKIPMEQRNLWPIVVDSNENIVWIPGLKKSKFDRTKGKKYDIILKYH